MRAQKAKKNKNKNTSKNTSKRALHFPVTFSSIPYLNLQSPKFNILPDLLFDERISSILSYIPASPKNINRIIESWKKDPFPKAYQPLNTSLKNFWSPIISIELSKAVLQITKVRWIFRRFLHAWRSKHLKNVNSEDIVTMEIPKKPVEIVDWKFRNIYLYESSTLMKDITSRLMNYDGFFEDSQIPRNPLTNNPLTQSQIISVWNQLKNESPSSAFTTFRQSRWNINKFRTIYNIPLHLHAFRKIMRTPTHIDYKDRVMDFIQLAYEYKSKEIFETAFRHVLRKYPDNPILYEWATLCIQYYEAEIIYYRTPNIASSIQRSVLIKSANLLNKQGELRNILLRDTKKLTDEIYLLL